MKTKMLVISGVFACTLAFQAIAEEAGSGDQLFKFHGCINCHGAEGKNPVSKIIPKLAGKPADELFKKAIKILSGEGSTEESKVMHAAFYSPSQCDHPPTDKEVKAITAWLSTL